MVQLIAKRKKQSRFCSLEQMQLHAEEIDHLTNINEELLLVLVEI